MRSSGVAATTCRLGACFFELLVKLVPHGQKRDSRIHDQHQRQDGRVPGGRAERGSMPSTTNESRLTFAHDEPTPRTVWINRAAPSRSTFASKPRHLHVDDVVERRRAARLLPDIPREHFARHEMP